MKKAVEQIYEKIAAEIDKAPGASQAKLCKQFKASYSGFRYWYARREANSEKEQISVISARRPTQTESSEGIPVHVGFDALMDAIIAGADTVTLGVKEVLANLSPEHAKDFVSQLGKRSSKT